jgi:hypothetical protein
MQPCGAAPGKCQPQLVIIRPKVIGGGHFLPPWTCDVFIPPWTCDVPPAAVVGTVMPADTPAVWILPKLTWFSVMLIGSGVVLRQPCLQRQVRAHG